MDRRDFLKGTLTSGGALAALTAGSSLVPAGASAAPADDSASAAALEGLRNTVASVEKSFSEPAWRLAGPVEMAEGRRYLMHVLQHASEVWLDADPDRPAFKRFVTPEKKMLGDNPDAVYFTAPVRAGNHYRVRGNIAGATYTSFTVEIGTGDGGNSTATGATLNDTEFDIRSDGSYEVAVGGEPQPRNWIALPEGAGSLTTRHYYLRNPSIAADRLHHVPIVIEPAVDPGPPPPPSDASIAAGIRRVAEFVRSVIQPPDPERSPSWVSKEPNVLAQPKLSSDDGSMGFAAVDNAYSMAPVVLRPDQALVIRGRYPKCRFANVVLWNRFGQTLDYTYRRTSLNSVQTALEGDGSFKVVVAHRDPGVPNWLDVEGHAVTTIFWRYLLAEEEIAPLDAKVVPLDKAASPMV